MSSEDLRARSKRKKLLIQCAIVAATIAFIWVIVETARTNLATLGITSGFGFLERATGWGYSFSLIERSIDDTYARTLMIGLMNTIFLGAISIVLSTILGFIIGTARDASNLAVQSAATIYVQIFRNIPLILQLLFWYAVLTNLPGPRQAYSAFGAFFLSARGLMVPVLDIPAWVATCAILFSVALAAGMVWMNVRLLRGILYWFVGTVLAFVLASLIWGPSEGPLISVPQLQGLRFRGGLPVSIELVAMVVSIVLYGSAYIAEVVRGGLHEVPKGLIEAGQALGLKGGTIWSRIKVPMALRTIIPPLGNQWIFIMKATTIGVAVGFSDLFYLVSTSITQSGQTLELIALLMCAFLLVNYSIALFVNWLNAHMKLKAH